MDEQIADTQTIVSKMEDIIGSDATQMSQEPSTQLLLQNIDDVISSSSILPKSLESETTVKEKTLESLSAASGVESIGVINTDTCISTNVDQALSRKRLLEEETCKSSPKVQKHFTDDKTDETVIHSSEKSAGEKNQVHNIMHIGENLDSNKSLVEQKTIQRSENTAQSVHVITEKRSTMFLPRSLSGKLPNVSENTDGKFKEQSKLEEKVLHSVGMGETVWHSTEMKGNVLHSTEMKGNVHSTEMEENVHSTEMGGNALHSTEMGGNVVHSTEMGGNALHSTEMEGNVLHSTEMKGNVLHSTEMEENVHSTEMGGIVVHSTEIGGNALHSTEMEGNVVHRTEMGRYVLHTTERGQDVCETMEEIISNEKEKNLYTCEEVGKKEKLLTLEMPGSVSPVVTTVIPDDYEESQRKDITAESWDRYVNE
ncbi:uncharacterized protein LOC121371175 [Gigantopelta aegis]|uniref:uncharacterized protein LOC121371175 n=1 Tax=Gigantopelta aegis TaxID=1735272 RepID=UPI001B88A967|nr:uncharacterized protein LOC121371175 [Gigantopelta aegis]